MKPPPSKVAPTFAIRLATEYDTAHFIACVEAAYAEIRRQIDDVPDVTDGIADEIAAGTTLVAELDGTIVGGIIWHIADDTAHIVNVAVSPGATGKGIGSKLIDHTVQLARAAGANQIDLATHPALDGNLRLYQRLGWRIIETTATKVVLRRDI